MQPRGKTSLFVIFAAASAAVAGLLFGYDTAVINGALVYLRKEFQLGSFETEMVATVLLWGCAAGAALAGWASDRFGRRVALFVAGILFCISAVGAAVPAHLWQLLMARLLGGLAIGSASLIVPLYIAEIAPAAVRGRLVTLNQLAIVIGILVAFVSNYALAHVTQGSWRWMFGLGAVPAVALCLSLVWIPESPRWLLQGGNREQALTVLTQISPDTDTKAALEEIGNAISEESGTYRELFSRKLRKPLELTIMLAIIQQVTGINTVLYYGSIVFAEHAGASASQAIGLNILVGAVNLLFTVVALLTIDRLGRRPLLLTATAGMGLCLAVFAGFLRYLPGHSLVLLVPVLGYVGCFAFGLGTSVWVCLAELFPNRIRGRAMSIATMVLWVSVSIVTATFLSLIKMFSASGVFLGYAGICTLSFLYIYFRLPETKNRTLEEIEAMWAECKETSKSEFHCLSEPERNHHENERSIIGRADSPMR
jgi:SP family arabinose:H+ symporter-like MFS transporter